MLFRNQEFRRELLILCLVGAVLTGLGCFVSASTGICVALACMALIVFHGLFTWRRYRRIQGMNLALDRLLHNGEPLCLDEYQEGELSILASQIQKMTLRLTESAQQSQTDRTLLADSLADISHQLRTPLTAIHLNVSLLAQRQLSEQRRLELIQQLRELLEGTQWLVETLLKLSKLEAGTVALKQEPVSVAQLIAQAAKPLAISMDVRGQRLTVEVGNAAYTGDLSWSAEALGNILKNATEHTPEGGTIWVQAEQNALFTQIVVRDTGPGFAKEDIPHLFERFYKGQGSGENSYGIGLALARQVITAQNGTVTAQNTPTGAQFVIKFYHQVI